MTKIGFLFTLTVLPLSLGSCSFFPGGETSNYTGYEDYLINEGYQKTNDIKDVNKAIGDNAYFWHLFSSSTYDCYYTGLNHMVYIYKDKEQISIVLNNSESFTLKQYKDGAILSVNEISVRIDENNHKWFGYDSMKDESKLSDEQRDYCNIYPKDNGYVVISKNIIFWFQSDYKDIYVCEFGSLDFKKDDKSKTITAFTELNEAIDSRNWDKVVIPASGTNKEMWHKMHKGSSKDPDYKYWYDVLLTDTDPNEYAEVLRNNGFTVNRADEGGIFNAFYGEEKGGYWFAYDEKNEINLVYSFQDYLYINGLGKSYGPNKNIKINVKKAKGHHTRGPGETTNETWSESELNDMHSWYNNMNIEIPFVKLGKEYSVSTKDSYAYESVFDNPFAVGHRCYTIYDEDNVYRLGNYGNILEENGYHLYLPDYDLTTFEGQQAYKKDENCKYYRCYINEEKDVAVKFMYSVNYGNLIRVFKKSEMKSYLQDPID